MWGVPRWARVPQQAKSTQGDFPQPPNGLDLCPSVGVERPDSPNDHYFPIRFSC